MGMQQEENSIKVSVVIPVYNMKTYLGECLESVRKQTLQDIEIICVDDGSDDQSPEILDRYADSDSRVRVIHKINSGYGHSVNIGIGQAKGKYVSIVEPDDYIKNQMLEQLYFHAEQKKLDIISSDYLWFYDDTDRRIFKSQSVYEDQELYGKVLNPFEDKRVVSGGFINPAGLFRRDFLNLYGIRHNETPGAAFQDRGFCFLTLIHAERIMVLREQFYCYRHDNPGSSIAGTNNIDQVIKEYRSIREAVKGINKKYLVFMPELVKREYGSCRFALSRCTSEFQRETLEKIRKEFLSIQKENQLNMKKFPEEWRRELLWILKNLEEYYQSFKGLRKEIHEKISGYEKVIIYGAGVVGRRIYDEMEEGDRVRVTGFGVTDPEQNIRSYKKRMVKNIKDYAGYQDMAAVIIGVTKKFRKEIIENLKEQGFQHLIILNSEGANI